MQLNEFEKHITSNINEYPSNLDTDALWTSLESDLDRQRNRRIFILLLALLAVSACVYMMTGVNSKDDNVESKTQLSIVEADKSIATLPTANGQQRLTTSKITTAQDIEIEPSSQGQASTASLQLPNNKAKQNLTSITLQSIKNNILVENSNLAQDPISSNLSQDIPAFGAIEGNVSERMEDIDYLNHLKQGYLSKAQELGAIKWDHPRYLPEQHWKISLVPQAGIYYTNRKVTLKDGQESDLLTLREESESALETVSLGIGIEFAHRSNFYLSGGLQMNQLAEQFFDQSSEFATESIEIVREINYLADGSVEEVTGMFEQAQETLSTVKHYNTLRWMEIAIGGGYRLTKQRWQIGVGAGLLWGSMLTAEGRIFDASSQIITLEDQTPSIYHKNLGSGGYAHLNLSYAIQPRLRLSTQLGYKYYASSVTEANYPLDIKYQWLGGSVGIQYRLY